MASLFRIDGAPGGGGELADYLSELGPSVTWVPDLGFDQTEKLQRAINEGNDPGAWFAFAASTAQKAWTALPASVRAQAIDQLNNLAARGLANLGQYGGAAASAVAGSVGEVVPLIGPLIQALVDFAIGIAKAHKAVEAHKAGIADINKGSGQIYTIFDYDEPDDWIYTPMKCRNYLDWVDGTEWRSRPAFARGSGAADFPFLGVPSMPDIGYCDKGTEYKCTGTWAPFDCHIKDSSDTKHLCVRHLGISALFYPYWSGAYPAYPLDKFGGLDPNPLLIQRQFALTSIPDANLRVDLERAIFIARNFHAWFMQQVQTVGLSGVNKEGTGIPTSPGGRLGVADEKIPNYVPVPSDKKRFYLTEPGLIETHVGADADPSEWGVPAMAYIGAPNSAIKLMVTVAQHNAVLGGVLGLVAARAFMLRQGPIMKALVATHGLKRYDRAVRPAMEYAARYGKAMSPPRLVAPLPSRIGSIVAPALPPGQPSPGAIIRVPPPRRMRGPEPPEAVPVPALSKWLFGGSLALAGAAVVGPPAVRFVRDRFGR